MKTELNTREQLKIEIRSLLLEEENNRPDRVKIPSHYDDFALWVQQMNQVSDYLLHKLEDTSEVLPALSMLCEDIGACVWPESWFYGEEEKQVEVQRQQLQCIRLLQKIHARTRFHFTEEARRIQRSLSHTLWQYGGCLVSAQWFDLAGIAFQKAHELGDCLAGTELAELVLRRKSANREEFSTQQLMDLLWPGVCAEYDESLVLMAVILALELGTPEDWQLGDRLMSRVSGKNITVTMLLDRWIEWERENRTAVEPKLALTWLKRYGIEEKTAFKLEGVNEFDLWISLPGQNRKLPFAPSWLYETAKNQDEV